MNWTCGVLSKFWSKSLQVGDTSQDHPIYGSSVCHSSGGLCGQEQLLWTCNGFTVTTLTAAPDNRYYKRRIALPTTNRTPPYSFVKVICWINFETRWKTMWYCAEQTQTWLSKFTRPSTGFHKQHIAICERPSSEVMKHVLQPSFTNWVPLDSFRTSAAIYSLRVLFHFLKSKLPSRHICHFCSSYVALYLPHVFLETCSPPPGSSNTAGSTKSEALSIEAAGRCAFFKIRRSAET